MQKSDSGLTTLGEVCCGEIVHFIGVFFESFGRWLFNAFRIE